MLTLLPHVVCPAAVRGYPTQRRPLCEITWSVLVTTTATCWSQTCMRPRTGG